MTPERWTEVERLYHAALACEPVNRAAFLSEACAGDDALRQAVDGLLARQPDAASFLEAPAWQSVAAALVRPLTTSSVGRVIGSFEVVAPLGAGGMGEVYRARDRRLGRDVALKFLTSELALDVDAWERLRREARSASALNHPHICTLHDIVDDDGRPVLVMEIVDGEPLSAVIHDGGLPIESVVRYGEQLADALAHAHAHGIVHRDLKPSNIVVTPDGRAKVLDFGIAGQMRDADLAAAGTLSYLPPEVLLGRPADGRSDIWSLGVVLYEMATGTRPFEGSTGVTLADAILHEPARPLPARVPGMLRAMLQKCLAKDPSRRYQSAAEIRAVLEMMRTDQAAADIAADVGSAASPRRARSRIAGWGVVAALITAVALAAAAWSVRRQAPFNQPARMTMTLGPDESFERDGRAVAISPDGRRVAYVARHGEQQRLYLRALDRFEATLLAGTDGAAGPFFSPDGRWVGFFANGKLQKVSIEGGPPVTLCDAPHGRGADWGADDSIIFAADAGAGLSQISAMGGSPRPVTTLSNARDERSHRAPQILPGGKTVLFTAFTGQALTPSTRVVSLVTGETSLIETGSWARYVPGDRLIYVSNGVAVTAPFDPRRLVVTGVPTPVTEDLRQSLAPRSNLWTFAVSAEGSLVFIPGGRAAASHRSLVWVDRHGVATPQGNALHSYQQLRLSPDGQRLALTIREPSGTDIWIYELTRDGLTRLTSDGTSQFPVWSPDARRVAFASSRFGPTNVFVRAADGAGPVEQLASDLSQAPSAWSPDGRLLVVNQIGSFEGMVDIGALLLQGLRTPRLLVQRPGYQMGGRISPDGQWLAYVSDESGQFEVHVTSFPGGLGNWKVSAGGGTQVVWARSGRELFYRTGHTLLAVPIETRSGFAPGKPVRLFEGRYVAGDAEAPDYDVSLDGERFVMIETRDEDVTTNQINVVLGWSNELNHRENVRTP